MCVQQRRKIHFRSPELVDNFLYTRTQRKHDSKSHVVLYTHEIDFRLIKISADLYNTIVSSADGGYAKYVEFVLTYNIVYLILW